MLKSNVTPAARCDHPDKGDVRVGAQARLQSRQVSEPHLNQLWQDVRLEPLAHSGVEGKFLPSLY
jgi:hypothetical protein